MSAHKKSLAVSDSGIVVGDGKSKRRYGNLRFKLAGIGLVCICLLAGVAFGTYSIVHHPNKPITTDTHPKKTTTEDTPPPPTTSQQAEADVVSGNYAAANQIYTEQLNNAKDKKSQSSAYLNLGNVAVSAQEYTQAYAYVGKADALVPTSGTAQFLGDIAALQGDNKTAAQQYQIAISRLDKKSPTYAHVANQIQAKLDEVTK